MIGWYVVKARILFRRKWSEHLVSGKVVTIFMDCYQIDRTEKGFGSAYKFSWVAFNADSTEERILMDQHSGRPCHLHIGTKDSPLVKPPRDIEEAIDVFFEEVKKYFGPVVKASE